MRRLPLILVLSLAAACGRGPTTPNRTGEVAASGSSPTATATATDASGAPTTGSSNGTTPAAKGSKKTGGFPSPGPNPRNTLPLTVTINRKCAKPGDEMSSTATTVKGAQLAFSAGYADNSLIPDFTFVPKESNVTGTYTWTWVIRPMRSGDAMLSVVASKEGKGAAFNIPFKVAQAC